MKTLNITERIAAADHARNLSVTLARKSDHSNSCAAYESSL
jgi:hypothetical protein